PSPQPRAARAVRHACPAARLARGAADPSARTGGVVGTRRLAVLGAAPLRRGALDGAQRMALRRCRARGLVVAAPAAATALADRQHRLPSRPPPRSPRAELPPARRARRPGAAARDAAARPRPRAGRPLAHAVGRERRPAGRLPRRTATRMMKFLGRLRGNGTLVCGDEQIGAADYDLDGFMTRPGEVVASGELRMSA